MSEFAYIDVTGSALIVRPVEMLCATIKISVTTKKAAIGLALSLTLRDSVIQAIKAAGIADDCVTDAGCSVGHSTWSSKKQLTHKLSIQSKETQTFANAMAAVEQVFAAARTGYFSGTTNDFSFVEAEPIYARTEEANELAIREAMKNAAAKAAIIADQAGLSVGPVMAVIELVRPRRKTSHYDNEVDDPMDFDAHLAIRGYDMESISAGPSFSEVAPRQTTGMVQLRVRFGVEKLA